MNLSKHETKALSQALSYAVMYANTEEQTAEFAMLKIKVDGEIIRQQEAEDRKIAHSKKGCPFQYCDSKPCCVDKCKYSK